MLKKVEIYTDGACSGNPGIGGFGAILMFGTVEKELSGFENDTTNNRMELTAPIKALELLKEKCDVTLYSDSSYLINAFNLRWIYNWEKAGWKTDKGEERKNSDLWKILLDYSRKQSITWVKVKGHSDNEYNNRCDKLAVNAIKTGSSKKTIQYEAETNGDNPSCGNSGQRDLLNLEEKTISTELLLNGRIFDVERIHVELPDGTTGTRDVLRHSGAAAVIAVDNERMVYMVKQYRKAVDKITLEIPAGKLDAGEDPETAAIRELREETGLITDEVDYLTTVYPTFALSNEAVHIYLTTEFKEGESAPDEGEFVQVKKYPLDILVEMITLGEIQDSKTIAGILLAEKVL